MISMPIQQFTSCFYVIPNEHKFFDQTKEDLVKADERSKALKKKEAAYQSHILTANSAELLDDDGFGGEDSADID